MMSAPINVAMRADAGASLGTGHYARASAVADALLAAGGTQVILATDKDSAALVPAYFRTDVAVIELEPAEANASGTMDALRRRNWTPDVIYLDQYGDVAAWEAQAVEAGIALIVLDDLDAASCADVIVRPHGGQPVERNTIVLRGPAYLPLSRHVTSLAERPRRQSERASLRLNICFGGSDQTGETAKALQALSALPDVDVDVVIGPAASVDPQLLDGADRSPRVTLHRAPSQEKLAELMSAADLALGAGGVMLWERMCLGVPSLVISVAPNQRPQIDAMAAAGAIRFLGDQALVTPDTIARSIAALAADRSARETMTTIGQELVDGRGAVRLAGWLRALALDSRAVEFDDAEDLLSWRTDDRNWQHNWATADKPSFAAHVEWLKGKLADRNCVFRIIAREDEPVGVVRFDLSDGGSSAYMSIYLVPAWHGRKMGLSVYLAAERALRLSHPGVCRIVSRIDADNSASERLHRDAGFDLTPSKDRASWLDTLKLIDA